MTTETTEAKAPDPSVGATTDIPESWHQINWWQAERTVRRLQAPIAQATQAKEMGQGESEASSLHPLVERQSPWRATSEGKYW
jgi:hypothetical protein